MQPLANEDREDLVPSAVVAGMLAAMPNVMARGGGAFQVLPEGAKVEDLERFLLVPPYARGLVAARTTAALVAYVSRHRTDDTSFFADVESGTVRAVIDWLPKEPAGAHKLHHCVYAAPFSEEWKRWNAVNGKPLSQEVFAAFIEENRDDVVKPDGAEMLELAKTLDAKKKVTFKSGIRLDNGNVDLNFTDDTVATGGINGKIPIPTQIELGIPVFYGGDRYRVMAFFRYRIPDGKLALWVDLHRIKHVRDAAFNDIIASVRNGCPGVPLYEAAV